MTGLLPPYYNYTMFVEAAFFSASIAAIGHAKGPRGAYRVLLAAGAILALVAIFLSRSRQALCAALFSLSAYALSKGSMERRILLWATLAACAVLAFSPMNWWSHLLKLDFSQWFTRPQIWKSALRVFLDHPWFGEGLGNFPIGFRRHNFAKHWASNYGFYTNHAHSEPLEILSETGLPGLLLFIAALAASVRLRRDDYSREAAFFAACSMAAQGLVDNMLQLPALGLLFFSALACCSDPAPASSNASRGASNAERAPLSSALGVHRLKILWVSRILPVLRPAVCLLGIVLTLSAPLPQRFISFYWKRHDAESDPARRLQWLEKIERLSPADEEPHLQAARDWLNTSPPHLPQALEQLSIAETLNPTNALYPALEAEIWTHQGQWKKAVHSAQQAIALEPNFLEARLIRAEGLARLGRTQEGRQEIERIRERRLALSQLTLFNRYDQTIAALDPSKLQSVEKTLTP